MRSLLPAGLVALCLAGCSASEDDTAQDSVPLFDEAVLEPPFKHANALWAGPALTDANGDGQLDIVLTNGTNHRSGLYLNQGDGRFVDSAEEAGIPAEPQHGGVVAGDIDNDGDEDLVMTVECSYGTLAPEGIGLPDGGFEIYRNDGTGHYTLEEPSNAVKAMVETCPISVDLFDMDNDGDLDLLTANGLDMDQFFPWVFRKDVIEAADYVMINDGSGRFTNAIQVDSPIKQAPNSDKKVTHFTTFTSVMLDLDEDGEFERIAGSGGTPVGVWSNENGALFFEPERSEVDAGLWMGLAHGDFTGNGKLELYGTNMGLSPLIAGYDNLLDYTETVHGSAGHSYLGKWSTVLDASVGSNIEGHADFFDELDTNIFHGIIQVSETGALQVIEDWPVYAPHALAGDFFDGFMDPESGESRYPYWVQPEGLARYAWSWGAVALDFDADGWLDVAFNGNNCSAPMDIIWDEERGAGPGALFRNLEGSAFEDVTWAAGVANVDKRGRFVDGRGIATGDLNGDGYSDLVYANRSYNPSQSDPLAQELGIPRVWLSQPRAGNWLRVKLTSETGNRQGIGAMVWVDDGTRETAHGLGLGGGTNSSNERALTLGLGETTEVDLRIRFVSGHEVSVENVAANQEITVSEQ